MPKTDVVQGGKVLALYQDTRGSTALVIDSAGRILGRSYAMVTQHRPQAGWVEYDPYEVWHRSWQAVEHAGKAAGVARDELAAMGIATQRGTVVLWERSSGQPVGPAISWECQRSADICRELQSNGHEEAFRQRSGGRLDTTAAGPKIRWLLDRSPELRQRAERGEICCGTMDTWLLWNLTAGAAYATDWTNAAGTLLFDLRTRDWDDELLGLLDIPRAMLPQPCPSGHLYGQLRGEKVPVAALCVDQQAGLFGQACFGPGMAKVTYGRDAVAIMEAGGEPPDTGGQLRVVPAPGLDGESPRFTMEGQVLAAGVVVDWLRDELALIPTAADSEVLARQVKDSGGVYLIPAFQGLGAPYWLPEVRGGVVGLTAACSRACLVRAALEGVAYRVRDVVEALVRWSGQPATELRADGGAAVNNFLLQFQADLLGVPVLRNRLTHTAASGVAYMAGLQAGLWPSREAIVSLVPLDRRFDPALDEPARHRLYQGWQEAIRGLLSGQSKS